MSKHQDEMQALLALIGGRENISAVSHCITRLRFVLNDTSKADIAAIEALPSVKGTFSQAGQFQVIIGNNVAEFYRDFSAVSGVEGVSKDQVKEASKQNQNVLQRALATLAEIFAPLIPAIITGGLILGFRNVINSVEFFENGTKTLCDISQFWTGIDHFLWLIGEAVFHMLPVGICWSVAKKMGATQMLGIILGLTLVSPQLLNAYAVGSTAAANIPVWNFGYFTIEMIGYQAQVLPAIFAGLTLAYLERFFTRITPQVISMVVVPFASLLLSVVIAHFVLGPVGWTIGSAISFVVYAGITSSFNVVFGALFGFVYAPLVITGLHHMSNAIDMQLIADFGGTMLWPMIALSNIAQGSAVLGMVVLQRANAKAQEVNVPSLISCYLGVTEPAMFGVNLKFVFPFVCAMIGSAMAGAVSMMTGTTAQAIGIGGVPGILSIKPQFMGSFAVAMMIAIAVPFLLTVIVGAKKLKQNLTVETDDAQADIAYTTGATELNAFVKGRTIPIEEVNDAVFSAKVMGDGFAIIPEDDTIYAPCDGEVVALMDESKHAIGLKLANDMEILIHIGLDTVNMKGDGFEYRVAMGDKVSTGTPLVQFDRQKIKAHGYSDVVICVITEEGQAKEITYSTDQDVTPFDCVVSFA